MATLDQVLQSLRIAKTHPEYSEFVGAEQVLAEEISNRMSKDTEFEAFLRTKEDEEYLLPCNSVDERQAMGCWVVKLSTAMNPKPRSISSPIMTLHAFCPEGDAEADYAFRSLIYEFLNATTHVHGNSKYPIWMLKQSHTDLRTTFYYIYTELVQSGWPGTLFIFIHGMGPYHRKHQIESDFLLDLVSEIQKKELSDEDDDLEREFCIKILYTDSPQPSSGDSDNSKGKSKAQTLSSELELSRQQSESE
ncbi:hypothetical protein BDV96DRAFT_693978 [Lophiotrema nucula]|uniref:Uncharacterized protein n=1 Tax=Lophiotrema nucula TaxID=690887 RepID=A0A6A5YIU2_9PLEO|nr:hypothetical protein BDV96DRAFT_693978 [Lophiotrema nucula]